jgi:hypothetical protein
MAYRHWRYYAHHRASQDALQPRSSNGESKSSVRLPQQKKQIILCHKEKEHTEVK